MTKEALPHAFVGLEKTEKKVYDALAPCVSYTATLRPTPQDLQTRLSKLGLKN